MAACVLRSLVPSCSPQMRPIALETKNFLGRRLRRLRLEPAYGLRADVLKSMDATDPGPDHVAGSQVVGLAVRDRANPPAEDQVRFLEGVIVGVDLGALHILNQEQRLMNRTEGAVDEHLDGHARGGVESLHLRRRARAGQLGFVEVAE